MAARSIASKLTGLSVLSSVVAVLLAGAAFVAYDFLSTRAALVARVRTMAEIVALNGASALVFDDADAARSTLAAMQAEPSVVSAGIRAKGRMFATYSRQADVVPPTDVPEEGRTSHRFDGGFLWVYSPVTFENQSLGTLFIQTDLVAINTRLRRYVMVVLVVSGLAVLLTLAISRRLQREISRPVLALADAARAVSVAKDYSVRAPGGEGEDELALLVRTFNEMLGEIQTQHAEISEARQSLERRVEERTRALATANQELEAFSYSVSHDLRAPLRAIDGFSKALGSAYDEQLDARARHYLARIRAGTQRMSELIDDLLLLARVTRAELVRRPVDVSALARSIGTELCRRHPERRIDFRVSEPMTARADSHLLQIVFENLLGNAWKFTGREPNAVVEVGESRENGHGTFFVRDNGAGFDMAHASKLFGAFQRLHSESDYEGTGIGLATVQRIVSRHGGRIWADSAVGKGATFFFTLGEAA